MYAKHTQKLRRRAGAWLRELREKRGLSQRGLAERVGAKHYTIISQVEHGSGCIPPDRYLVWAETLGVQPREFVRTLMSYYDPVTYDTILGGVSRTNIGSAFDDRQRRSALVPDSAGQIAKRAKVAISALFSMAYSAQVDGFFGSASPLIAGYFIA